MVLFVGRKAVLLADAALSRGGSEPHPYVCIDCVKHIRIGLKENCRQETDILIRRTAPQRNTDSATVYPSVGTTYVFFGGIYCCHGGQHAQHHNARQTHFEPQIY